MFGKIITAVVTPFSADGSIDLSSFEKLIEHLINTGSTALVLTGTTGEASCLAGWEKKLLWKTALKVAKGRVPIIAGIGTNSTEETIKLGQISLELGCFACMVVVPYYNKPNALGIYNHFKKIAENIKLPIILYNVPSRTGVSIDLETIKKLSEIENIVAIKDASGDLLTMTEIICGTSLDVYCGDDSLTLPAAAIGAKGVISVASHIIGEKMQKMLDLFTAGQNFQAAQLNYELLPIMKVLFSVPNPVGVKYALKLKGINVGDVRLPLVPPTITEKEKIKRIVCA